MTNLPTLNAATTPAMPRWKSTLTALAQKPMWHKMLLGVGLVLLMISLPLWQVLQTYQVNAQIQHTLQKTHQALQFQQRKVLILQKKMNEFQSLTFSHELAPISQFIERANSAQLRILKSQWQGDNTTWLKLNATGKFIAMKDFLQALSRQYPQLRLIRLSIAPIESQPNTLALQTLWQLNRSPHKRI